MADRASRQHEAAARGAGKTTPTVRRKAAAKKNPQATRRKPAVAERVRGKAGGSGRKKAQRGAKRGERETARDQVPAKRKVKKKVSKAMPGVLAAGWTAEQMLANPAHERFCQLYSDGRFSGRSCYAQAFGAENDGTCRTMACSLLTNVDIQQRIAWLREESLKNWKCEKEEVMRFLHAVVMTPVGYVDEESPLAQEVTREEVQTGGQHGRLRRGDADEGNEVETPETTLVKTKVKMPGKKECAELLAKMQGWEKPAEVKLNVSYEPPAQALKRAADKGVDLVSILKKAGIRL